MKVLKKKFDPRKKEILTTTFKSIVSNQSCIDGAKTNPLWIAIVFLVLGLMLPLIPVMVNASKVQGRSFMTASKFTFSEIAVSSGLKELYDNKVEFKIDGNNELAMYEHDTLTNLKVDATASKEKESIGKGKTGDERYDDYPIYRFTITDKEKPTDPESYTEYAFDIYYASSTREYSTGTKGTSVVDLIDVIAGRHYKGKTQTVLTTQQEKELDPKKNEYAYIPSFLLFHKTGVYACICPKKGASFAASSSAGGTDFTHTKAPNGLLNRVLTIKIGNNIIPPENVKVNLETHQKAVYENLAVLFDEVIETFKWNAFRNNSLIYLGVFAGVELLMGTLVFVLTRGKKNIFNYLSFFTCQKIAWNACFTPAVIGLLAGFLFNNQSLMIFIMASGIRIMWLSMKQLRPQ